MIFRTPWVTDLSEDERQDALDYHLAVKEKVERFGPNYTGLMDPLRFFTGAVGEYALHHWCDSLGLIYEVTTNAEGRPDEQDVVMYLKEGKRITVNVKNTLHPRAAYLMQPVDQAGRHKQDIYIGAKSVDHGRSEGRKSYGTMTVQLWGSCTRQEFQDLGDIRMVRINTRQIALRELPHSMEQLGSKMKDRSNFEITL